MTQLSERLGSVNLSSSVSLADTAFFDEDSVVVAVPPAAAAVFAAWSDEARDRYYEEDLNSDVERGEVALAEGVSLVWFRPGRDANEVYGLVDLSGTLRGVELLSLTWEDSRVGRAESAVDE